MVSLITSLRETVFGDEVKDVAIDLGEVGIDGIMDEGVLREVPILKTIISVYHIGNRIRERKLLRNTIAFINAFNEGEISREEVEKYLNRLEEKKIVLEDELERILYLLEENAEKEQSQILARMYLAYIRGKIDWNKFCELSEVNKRMILQDIRVMRIFENRIEKDFRNDEKHQLVRLMGLGMLVERKSPAARDFSEIGDIECKYMKKINTPEGIFYAIDDTNNQDYEITNFGDLYLSFVK